MLEWDFRLVEQLYFQLLLLVERFLGLLPLLVTAPMDIYQIVANAKDLAASREDKGKEKDPIYGWYSEMIETFEEELVFQHTQ